MIDKGVGSLTKAGNEGNTVGVAAAHPGTPPLTHRDRGAGDAQCVDFLGAACLHDDADTRADL